MSPVQTARGSVPHVEHGPKKQAPIGAIEELHGGVFVSGVSITPRSSTSQLRQTVCMLEKADAELTKASITLTRNARCRRQGRDIDQPQ
jgi:hypothetical protein